MQDQNEETLKTKSSFSIRRKLVVKLVLPIRLPRFFHWAGY